MMNTYLPFSIFNELHDADRLFDRLPDNERRPQWQPAVDICENDSGYLLTMDIPGVAADAIDVAVHNGVLTVSGERKLSLSDKRLSLNERWQGKFVRRFSLPELVDDENIIAKCEQGVQALNIPKSSQQQPRKILVQ
jgi:HSP20 family protein